MALDEATAGFLTQLAESGAKPLHELTPGGGARLHRRCCGICSGRGRTSTSPTTLRCRRRRRQLHRPRAGPGRRDPGAGRVLPRRRLGDRQHRRVRQPRPDAGERAATPRLSTSTTGWRPSIRYPAAADDAWTALQWAHEHMTEIAGGPVPLIVMGDSAGGNLSAVVAQKARDAGGPELASQVLIYPVTDADLDNGTYTDPENQLMLTRESMIWFWDHYAPDPASRAEPGRLADPGRRPDRACARDRADRRARPTARGG